MGFNIQATIGADGSGFFREMNKVERSQAALDAKISARNFEKLDHQGKLNALKQEELALSNRAFALAARGDTVGANRATMEALDKRAYRERLITQEKEKQSAVDVKLAAEAKRLADAAERTRRATVAGGLRHGPSGEKKADGLALAGQLGVGALSGFGAPLGAAAASGAAIFALKGALSFADEVSDAAEQMGVTVNEFQKLQVAAGRAGVSVGDFQLALSQIDSQRREAAEGNSELQSQFKRFGVTLDDLNNPALRHLDILKKLTAQTGQLDAAGRGALKQLLGRRGDRLGGALGEFAGVTDNEVVSDGAIGRLDELNKKVEMVGHGIKNWGIEALAFWDQVAEASAKLVYSFGDMGVLSKHKGLSREDTARRAYRLDTNAGLAAGDMSAEAKLFNEYVNRPDAQRNLTFEKFAAERGKQEQATLFTNKVNKQLEQDIAEIVAKRNFKALSGAEKEAQLKKEIMFLEEDISVEADKTAKLKLQKAMEEKRGQLADLDKPDKPDKGGAALRPEADSLARRGIFVGGSPVGVRTTPLTGAELQREVTRLAQSIATENAKVVQAVNNSARTTKEVLG